MVHYEKLVKAASGLKYKLWCKTWFRFPEVDINFPRELWKNVEGYLPLFNNRCIPDEAIPQHMKEYLKRTGRSEGKAKKLCGQLTRQKLLLAPLLQWCLEHGLEITAMYRTIDYRTGGLFTWFVDEVNQRRVDEDAHKALLAEVFKLLGNSAYGKLIEAKERQTMVIYTKDQSVVYKAKRSVWFENMFELAFRKDKVKINRPFQAGIC